MKHFFLRNALYQRNHAADQYLELKELGKFCEEDAIDVSKKLLATPVGLLGSFSAGALTGWNSGGESHHRKRKALLSFGRIWLQNALL